MLLSLFSEHPYHPQRPSISIHPPSQPFAKVLPQKYLVSDAIPVFRKLAADDQDSVRLLTVDALIAIASSLPDKAICKQQLGPTMKAMVSDKSWRVRYMIADHFVQLAEGAGQDVIREELVGAFVHLLKDNEAEVRTAAAGQIPGQSAFFRYPPLIVFREVEIYHTLPLGQLDLSFRFL